MLTLTVSPESAQLIIGALRQLPHAQVHDLVMDLFTQVRNQVPPEAPQPAEAVTSE